MEVVIGCSTHEYSHFLYTSACKWSRRSKRNKSAPKPEIRLHHHGPLVSHFYYWQSKSNSVSSHSKVLPSHYTYLNSMSEKKVF